MAYAFASNGVKTPEMNHSHQNNIFQGGRLPSLVLLDRDGVINEDVGSPGVLHSSQLKLTPGAGSALGRLKRAGCKLALITNQSCVGKGLISEEDLVDDILKVMQDMLMEEDKDALLDHMFYCTSVKDSGDWRSKPNPGMVEEACAMFGIDPADCVMIGDAVRDLEAAASGGVPLRILVETGYGKGIMHGREASSSGIEGEAGSLELDLIDEQFCRKFQEPIGVHIYLRTQQCDTEDEDHDPEPYISVLPFYYAKNLKSAVDWMFHRKVKTLNEK